MPKHTFTKLKEQEREARRRIIIDAAERVFGAKPFATVSMRDIAREAGISPASIYRYFPDQQTLFVEAFLVGVERLIPSVRAILDQNGERGLEQVAEAFIDFLAENDHYFRMMTHFMLDGRINAETLDKLNAVERSLLDQFDDMFRRAGATRDVRLLSHAFFAALNGVLISFRNYPGRAPDEVRRHMHRLAGLLSRAFLKSLEPDPKRPVK